MTWQKATCITSTSISRWPDQKKKKICKITVISTKICARMQAFYRVRDWQLAALCRGLLFHNLDKSLIWPAWYGNHCRTFKIVHVLVCYRRDPSSQWKLLHYDYLCILIKETYIKVELLHHIYIFQCICDITLRFDFVTYSSERFINEANGILLGRKRFA